MSRLERLRDLVQSALAGVQRLEDLDATDEDFGSDFMLSAEEFDSDVWWLIDWIEDGRPS